MSEQLTEIEIEIERALREDAELLDRMWDEYVADRSHLLHLKNTDQLRFELSKYAQLCRWRSNHE